jgi:hypothetical protein
MPSLAKFIGSMITQFYQLVVSRIILMIRCDEIVSASIWPFIAFRLCRHTISEPGPDFGGKADSFVS